MLSDSLTAGTPAQSAPNEHEGRKPSHWEPEFSEGALIEWHCGECHKIVYYSLWRATYCPHCGAPIFNFPRRKLDAPQHRGMSYNQMEKMKYAGPDQKDRSRSLEGRRGPKPAKDHSHHPGAQARRQGGRV